MRPRPTPDQELQWLQEAARRRYRRPVTGRAIKNVVAELLTQRRMVAPQQQRQLREAWRSAVGSAIAECSMPGRVSNGMLEVIVADSVVAQEIALRRSDILRQLRQRLPDQPISRLRTRVGSVGG